MRLPGRKRLEVKAARPTTEKPKPRVLVVGIDDDDFVERLSERVPTVRVPRYLSDVDLHEWDCVITRSPWTSSEFTPGIEASYGQDAIQESWTWTQHLPPHVSVLYAVRPSEYRRRDIDLIDFWPSSGEGVEPPGVVVVTEYEIQGQHVAMVEGLPDHLTELVRRHLLPIAERRDAHTIFDVRGRDVDGEHPLHLTPLLFGPRETHLAAMYERTDEASVWLLPEDVEDLLPWTLAALREWHDLYPDRFPSLPDWPNDRRFRSNEETRLHKELDEKTKEIVAAVDRYYDEKTAIEARLAEADAAAAGYERALLTEQGDRLEIAVLLALQELGFSVRHMDAEREGQPKKEDYRITDAHAPDWSAIAEAKGFIKGVKEVGMISLERWATAYVHETGQEPSARWYIANQHIREDPDTRPAPFKTRPDLIEQLQEIGTLLIDTYALFRLVRAVQDEPALKPLVRARLRNRVGRLSHDNAAALLADARSDPAHTEP